MTEPAGREARPRAIKPLSLPAAERLFAERGVRALSDRQIADAAGRGDAVTGGPGTKAELVRAITRGFTAEVERSRVAMIAETDSSAGIRDWLRCLIRPWTDHFSSAGTTYFARLCEQVMVASDLKAVVTTEACRSPSLRQAHRAVLRSLPALPDDVAAERGQIVGQVIVHMCADRERAPADGAAAQPPSWRDLEAGLLDALVGIWTAPCTRSGSGPGSGR
ncbi:TetR family transcriptional regulator [Saccharopolyspora sp. HNM0983]|uniref:TetR family transcriptional regulator n=1 Tax=Saccharopolyspora montiporae TaxID=2781240 RepID=A0A929B4Y9_9PSEU|nr:TetR family transcriptional regulator [Saccharopolyspora sp. HNM0983]MBE9373274.1 TetR family transcriptional regulator [Saccharopolyspora sp. HNM0983]